MTDLVAFSDAQFQRLLASLPVFFSALSAMCVGILLERYKDRRERIKAAEKKAKDELTAINVATVATSTNLELLIHYAFQNLLETS